MLSLICSDVEARTLELENQVRQLKQLFKPWYSSVSQGQMYT